MRHLPFLQRAMAALHDGCRNMGPHLGLLLFRSVCCIASEVIIILLSQLLAVWHGSNTVWIHHWKKVTDWLNTADPCSVSEHLCLLHRHDLKAGNGTWDHLPKLCLCDHQSIANALRSLYIWKKEWADRKSQCLLDKTGQLHPRKLNSGVT